MRAIPYPDPVRDAAMTELFEEIDQLRALIAKDKGKSS
jgi:hypothetical protein